MDKGDWKKFVAIVNAADENVGKPRSKEAVAMMFEVLKDYDIADVARAVHRLMRSSPYCIKPSDVVREIDGTASDRSAEAWQLFKRALYDHGSFDSVAFPDPAYHWAILKMGGWEVTAREFEQYDDRELNFREKDFRQLYERGMAVASFEDVPGRQRVPRYLWGECERNNRECGYSLEFTPIYAVAEGRKIPRSEIESLTSGARATARPISDIAAKAISRLFPAPTLGCGGKV